MSEIENRRAANLAKVVEDGPRLRSDYSTWIEARGDGKVLRGGLGGLGQGRMWVTEGPRDREDPTYADAPYAPETKDGFGETGHG